MGKNLIFISLLFVLICACSYIQNSESLQSENISTQELPTVENTPEITIKNDRELSDQSDQSSKTDGVMFYIKGHNFLYRNEYVEAERTFDTLIEIEPTFARGWEGRGRSLLFQGKYLEAIEDFSKAIDLKPNFAEAYANRGLAKLALEKGNYNLPAQKDADRALEINPETVNAHIVLARIYGITNNPDMALLHYNRAIKITNGEDGVVFWWRGIFYRDILRQYEKYLNDFDTAILLLPTFPSVYLDRAMLRIVMKAKAELITKDLKEAISLSEDPKNPEILKRSEEILKQMELE